MKYSIRSLLVSGKDSASYLMDNDHLNIVHVKGLTKGAVQLYHYYLSLPPSIQIDDDFVAKELSITKATMMKYRRELSAKGLISKERSRDAVKQAYVYLAPATGGKGIRDVVCYWEKFDAPYIHFLQEKKDGNPQ